MPTLKDVADKAGVSIATASRVLNNTYKENVSERTRQHVLQVVAEMGFRSNLLARGLQSKKTFQFSLIISNLAFSYMPEVVQGLQDVAITIDYGCLLYLTHGDPVQEFKAFEAALSRRVDGIIWMPSTNPLDSLAQKLHQCSVVEMLYRSGFPGLPTVLVDQKYGGYLAARHLLELGHKSIVTIVGTSRHWQERQLGYQLAVAEFAGVELLPPIVVHRRNWQQGVAVGNQLFSQHPRPTAILAASDEMAAGVLHAAEQASIRIPTELSILGFGDAPIARQVNVPLTTIGHPKREIGTRSMDMLAALMEEKEVADTVFTPVLVVRNSTAEPSLKE